MPLQLDQTPVLPAVAPTTAGELGVSSGRPAAYSGVEGRAVPIVSMIEQETYAFSGALSVKTGTARWYVEQDCVVESIRASVGTAPAGQAILVDINKNGTTIFSTQSNRPTIAAGSNTQLASAPDITAVSAGQYITVDVDQVGTTTAGSDLTVTIRLRRV